jgi:Na+-driven multidrug efflux pump
MKDLTHGSIYRQLIGMAAPIAGQNFGARNPERVRETFRAAAFTSCGIMAVLTLLCQWQAQ